MRKMMTSRREAWDAFGNAFFKRTLMSLYVVERARRAVWLNFLFSFCQAFFDAFTNVACAFCFSSTIESSFVVFGATKAHAPVPLPCPRRHVFRVRGIVGGLQFVWLFPDGRKEIHGL